MTTLETYKLTPGVSIFNVSADGLAIGGTEVNHFIGGMPELAFKFIKPFASEGGATFEDAFAEVAQVPKAAEFRSDFEQLLRLFVSTGSVKPVQTACFKPGFRKLHLLLPAPLVAGAAGLNLGIPAQVQAWPENPEEGLAQIEVAAEDPQSLLAAYGLEDVDLHRINRWALRHRKPWLFVTHFGQRSYFSPVLGFSDAPCYACLRIQRMGALASPAPNALHEHLVAQGEARLAQPGDPLSRRFKLDMCFLEEKLLSAAEAAVPGATEGLEMPSRTSLLFHRYDPLQGDLRPLQILKLPGCPVCA